LQASLCSISCYILVSERYRLLTIVIIQLVIVLGMPTSVMPSHRALKLRASNASSMSRNTPIPSRLLALVFSIACESECMTVSVDWPFLKPCWFFVRLPGRQ